MYLSGEFGEDPKQISPYIASTFYAADRYATYKKEFEEYYQNGGIILADRYTTANMVHQAGKIEKEEEREKFINWLFDLEFNLYGIPKPTEVFFLNMPTAIAQELMKTRENKFSHTQEKDIHERNSKHLEESYRAACSVSKKYGWYEIECAPNGKLKTVEEIHEEIYKEIKRSIV